MLIRKDEAQSKQNSGKCTVREYPFPSEKLGFATAKIEGRYPENGWAKNTVCDEIYFVISGKAKIHCNNEAVEIKTGDAFLFQKGEKYFVEGEFLEIAVITAPAWFAEQYSLLD